MTTEVVSAWLLTYLLHSTIILSAALAVSRLLGGRQLGVQETLLRTALVGGIVTASLQLGFGIVPAAGEVSLGAAVQPAVAAVIGPEPVVAGESSLTAPFPAGFEGSVWATPLVVFWSAASMLALVAVGRSVLDLRRLLRSRCFRPAGRLVESLAAAMGLRRKVRISTSKAVAVPFATGIRRPEICCPEHVVDLAIEHKRGLFAHELAHLVRRDPAWQLVYRLGEAMLVVQPLNRLVRRRLEELAELLADDRAAASTGDRLGLARCLVVVAHWGRSGDIGLPATALASGPRLDRRVRRLISRSAERHIDGRWAAAVGAAALTASTLLLPVVAAPPVHAESTGITVNETRTWSDAEDRPTETAPTAEPSAEPAPDPPTPQAAPADIPEVADAPPSPASPPSAPARSGAAPAPEAPTAAEIPRAAPVSEAPAAVPAPQSAPAPAAAPVPGKAPEPPTPPTKAPTAEAERRREDARHRESERAQERARAEACARRQREAARAQSERTRELAREAADRARLTDERIAEMQVRTRQLEEDAHRLAREAAIAERERSRAAHAETLELARQSALRARQLTDEQREAMRRQAVEMQKRAEAGQLEAQNLAEERARELADRARALAEQAEAERRDQEGKK